MVFAGDVETSGGCYVRSERHPVAFASRVSLVSLETFFDIALMINSGKAIPAEST